jgi:hypothetical protein
MIHPMATGIASVTGLLADTAVDLARIQFATTSIYHFLFVPLTLGLSPLVAIMQTLWYRSQDEKWLRLTRFFGTLFLFKFAIGVATGLVQEFEIGMNWSVYSKFVGNVFAQATHFHEAIARPNLLVKIPATDAGVPAIEEMTARGYAINVTLIFSLTRHRQVAEAYLRGLERLVASGGDPSRLHSVASFFVSRVDTETDRRLAETGRDDLKVRLGIANAKLAYQQYKALFHGGRWDALATQALRRRRRLPRRRRHARARGR